MEARGRSTKSSLPYSFSSSMLFEGSDGKWSTFVIRVGTPAQTFRVLMSSESHETWVPLSDACFQSDIPKCSDLRGIQPFENAPSTGFKVNQSSTWESNNLYELGLEDILNLGGNGQYGYETIGLGIQNSGGLTIGHQIVAGIVTTNYMFGLLGLNPKPTNFTDFNDPQPSLLWSLHNQSMIPSMAYSYSAGAYYRRSLAALTLGGYDSAQIDANKTLVLALESRTMMVGVQSIIASNTQEGVVSLLTEGIMAPIDSTIPEIWLPTSACQKFEDAFALHFDNSTERYIVNDTVHSQLKQLNPTITFKIGKIVYGGPSTNIVFPYAAFDQQISYPTYSNETNYFPIRRATNESQYIIGRVFLQEAYLTVDYGRGNFSLTQRSFDSDKHSSIVPIPPIGSITAVKHHALGRGTIIGVSIGLCISLLFLITGVYFYRRIKKKKQRVLVAKTEEKLATPSSSEAPDNAVHEAHGREYASEMDNGLVQEIGGKEIKAELPS